MTLTDFLLARIAEDEALAREIQSRRDTYEPGAAHTPSVELRWVVDSAWPYVGCDPVRVLAECKAKRRIVLSAGDLVRAYAANPASGDEVRDEAVLTGVNIYEEVLRAYAEPYADHSDFRGDWKP